MRTNVLSLVNLNTSAWPTGMSKYSHTCLGKQGMSVAAKHLQLIDRELINSPCEKNLLPDASP